MCASRGEGHATCPRRRFRIGPLLLRDMESDAFLESVESRLRDLTARGVALDSRIGSSQWDWSPGPNKWSAGQIFRHMVLANRPYVDRIPAAVDRVPRSERNEQPRFTLFGRFLIRAAGPTGNAPAPKALDPGPGPIPRESFAEWQAQNETLIGLCEAARGKRLDVLALRNQLLPLFRMTLADCFELIAEHTERHIAQIEALSLRPDLPE